MAESSNSHFHGMRKPNDFNDEFKNFSFDPPKPQGHFRAFTRRSRYTNRYMAGSKESLMRAGSSSSIASITGSTQNLLDPAKVMTMQEDARSRRITSEVMKNRLYESVITSPRKRRFSMRMDYSTNPHEEINDPQAYARMVQSLPVTPAHSQTVTPSQSPTSVRRFLFGFFSRGATPQCTTPVEMDEEDEMECEEDSWKGLASIFKPQPKYIPAAKFSDENMEVGTDCRYTGLMGPPDNPGIMLRPAPRPKRRAQSPVNDVDDSVSTNNF